MKVSVYHNAFGDEFIKVASFTSHKTSIAVALEEAYHATNTIDEAWYINKDLDVPKQLRETGVRSTSVDDYISIQLDDGHISWYVVASFGFDEVKLAQMVEYVRYPSDNEREYKTSRLLDLVMDAELRDHKENKGS